MKNFLKKVISSVAAVSMAVTIMGGVGSSTVFADEPSTDNTQTVTYSANDTSKQGGGSITITNAKIGETYSVYKIFDATSDGKSNNISYKLLSGKDTAFTTYLSTYFDKDDAGNITIKSNTTGQHDVTKEDGTLSDAAITAIKNYLGNDAALITTPEGGATKENVKFDKLPYGYYYVTSTVGSIVTIDSTNPSKDIKDKNEVSTVEKKITGVTDQDNFNPADSATAKIGDTITYTATITAKKGTTGLAFHDQLSSGLTLVTTGNDALSISYKTDAATDSTTMTEQGAEGTASSITYTKQQFSATGATANDTSKKIKQGDNITLTFNGDFTEDTTITITYKAVLNGNAVVGPKDGTGNTDGNPNFASITYGNNQESEHDKVTVYTYRFDLVKTDTSTTNIPVLTGAQFKLYRGTADASNTNAANKVEGATAIQFVKTAATGSNHYDTYRVATAAEIADTNTDTTDTIDAGYARIVGLANGTYALEETKAPEGYNKLTYDVKVTVNDANNDATVNYTEASGSDAAKLTYVENGVRVQNNGGSVLPSTGGIGTTIFYVIGGVLIAGAAILLITRKSSNKTA